MSKHSKLATAMFGLTLGLWMGACTEPSEDCSPGMFGCACASDQLCLPGLTCLAGVCVQANTETGGDGDTGDGDPGDGDGDGDTGDNPCSQLIECVSEAQPEQLSQYATLYGPEGECYDIPGLTVGDCWAECQALLDGLLEAYPDAGACGPPNCGDGKLDPDEACDGSPFCTATCRFADSIEAHECNPVTQVPCADDQRCHFEEIGNRFFCYGVEGTTPDNELGETCGVTASCIDPTALCVHNPLNPDCPQGSCCMKPCYLGGNDHNYSDCPDGLTCTSILSVFLGNWPDGSELLGFCWPD